MKKNNLKKILIALIISSFLPLKACAVMTLDDLNNPLPPAPRLGVSDTPEPRYATVKPVNDIKTAKTNTETIANSAYNNTFADLSLQKLARDVAVDLDIEADDMLEDLQMLWNAASSRSETIKYTIYKLSNPDENKPSEGLLKKIIRPIASFSSIAGTALSSNPYMASGALIGGGLLNAFTKDDKEINYNFTKVNDADMVLLVRKIDDLQKKLLNLYVDYLTKKEVMSMTLDNLEKRKEIYEDVQSNSREEAIIADVYYRNAQNAAKKAEAEFWASRTILENLVGAEVLAKIENKGNEN